MMQRNLLNWHTLRRAYSTITAEAATVSRAVSVDPERTPEQASTTSNEPVHDAKDPVVTLQRARSAFENKQGLWRKIGITTHLLRDPSAPVRIGLVGSHPSLLNTLLSDPFASDQVWYNSVSQRSNKSNNIIRYSSQFELKDSCFYDIPSPILQKLNLEIFELNDNDTLNAEDGCHLYISFQDTTPSSISKWPVYDWNDVSYNVSLEESDIPELNNKQINSTLSEKAVLLLAESPSNATIYTQLYSNSNLPEFIKFLQKVTEPSSVLKNLYQSILSNLSQQLKENSITVEELNVKDKRIKEYIQNWDKASHREFQMVLKPHVTAFESRNLQWWKLYYNADDVQAILSQMINTSLLKDSLKNYSYLKGQIDSFSSFQKQGETIDEDLSKLDQNALTKLKEEITENDLAILQSQALKILLTNALGVQLPIILVSIVGAVAFDFSLYSMAGLSSFGLVFGFNNISKQWLKEIRNFKTDLFERVRISIAKVNESLYNDWSVKYQEEKEQILKRETIINDLKSSISDA